MPSAHRPFAWLVVPLILAATCATAEAGFITYSSSGTLERPNVIGASDPWGIGNTTATIALSVTLSDTAPDRDVWGTSAFFGDVAAATFTINGNAAQVVPNAGDLARVTFFDGIRDNVTIDMIVFYNGANVRTSYIFSLPVAAFTFTRSLESPPAFASTQTASGSSVSVSSSPYQYLTSANTAFTVSSPVTATPAPPGLVLLLSGAATFGFGAVVQRLRGRRYGPLTVTP